MSGNPTLAVHLHSLLAQLALPTWAAARVGSPRLGSCTEVEGLLDVSVGGAFIDAILPWIDDHLASCSGCRAMAAALSSADASDE